MNHLIKVSEITSQINAIIVCDGLVQAYNRKSKTTVIIDFTECEFIYPDYILILVCTIKYLENIGFNIHGKIKINKD